VSDSDTKTAGDTMIFIPVLNILKIHTPNKQLVVVSDNIEK